MRLKPNNPALIQGRTIHPKRVRVAGLDKGSIIKPVAGNSKLGKGSSIVLKGEWAGLPMFSITLVERETCPNTCHHWDDCFGNNMGFAHRWKATPGLILWIGRELEVLAKKYRKGFVVRLHILGDFFSVEYVQAWQQWLAQYPMLRVFGYTARKPDTDIGIALQAVRAQFSDRWWIRQSSNETTSTGLYATRQDYQGNAITCPEQTGKTESCLTCGLCWSVNKPIRFLSH